MYLSTLRLWNFRKYSTGGGAFETSLPGLELHFNEKLNVLIGENNSGKTAIIDAIRYVLHTQSGEFIRVEEKDFYKPDNGNRTNELKIECKFRGLSNEDAGLFLEWLDVDKDEVGNFHYGLTLRLYAKYADGRIIAQTSVGSNGTIMDGEAREYLRVVYLKPLRDALADMTHGSKSRLAQILQAHPVMHKERGQHYLENRYDYLGKEINDYFTDSHSEGSEITNVINSFLNDFLTYNDRKKAVMQLTATELSDILRQLDLLLETNKSGLGSLNLLCIAAELLLFESKKRGLKLTLIEELEAHLHPQYQSRLINFIKTNTFKGQFILTTHSTTVGASIPMESMIILKENDAFRMDAKSTKLEIGDYRFLERFLDATKANLFFASGLIIVEGDAENLLIPEIAKLIGKPLDEYGVSIVNVGSTAYKRYVNIFKRADGKNFPMPVAIISDLDVRSLEYYEEIDDDGNPTHDKKTILVGDDNLKNAIKNIIPGMDLDDMPSLFVTKSDFQNYINDKECKRKKTQILGLYKDYKTDVTNDIIKDLRQKKKEQIEKEIDGGCIKIFLPNHWTLEYEIALSCIYKELYQATLLTEIEIRGLEMVLNDKDYGVVKKKAENKYTTEFPSPQDAYEIFKPLNDGDISKAMTAQYLAEILSKEASSEASMKSLSDKIRQDENLKYIVDTIDYVTK